MHDASKGSRDNVDVDVSHEPNYAGQAIYSPITLAVYDLIVLALSNPLIWRCPTGRILQLYDRHVTDNHLDVGVGTGWYLDRCHFPNPAPRIGLLDLNPNSLAAASRQSRGTSRSDTGRIF